MLFLTLNGLDYMVSEGNSIFCSRQGKSDINVYVRGSWGGLYGEGKRRGYYRTIRICDAQTGEVIRDYESVPKEVQDEVSRLICAFVAI